ncbi:MAG: RNA-binding transcriptional accessory protein [Spirochaetales bacterium]|nr:MAG: RNA-binding transcriptional accessory protein [Spirochaetales bacterium]
MKSPVQKSPGSPGGEPSSPPEPENIIALELRLAEKQVRETVKLLAEGGTVPFIARYRKEQTGGLDETLIIAVRDRLSQLQDLAARREAIVKSLMEQEKLTPELESRVRLAATMAELEDIYLPFRPKKRTRAMIAREKGLEPLSDFILGTEAAVSLAQAAAAFINQEKGVASLEDALQGARDIIAERINEDAEIRGGLRVLFSEKALLQSSAARGKEEEGVKYRDYFNFAEPASKAPSHRILAVLRGAAEGFLTFHILPDEETAVRGLRGKYRGVTRELDEQVETALRDSYRRLLSPSLETELKNSLKGRADREAINVFAENVRELLMAPPMGRKPTLAVDPGLRTGCKITCLGAQGELLHYETIYPLAPHRKTAESAERLVKLAERFGIQAIAVGNGTGGREALAFCESVDFGRPLIILSVNENGASVYSASETARKEFPDHDLTVRGAVSIGRRLMDPLSELVKIDPKAIGVGQYQHDVDQKALKNSLDDVVSSCVNKVGVELNTASRELLRYVAGLSEKTAGSIVARRTAGGPFTSRQELRSVPGLGEKTFEQAAGFLRIRGGEQPLDASAVHPERYALVEKMAADLGCTLSDLLSNPALRKEIRPERYVSGDAGLPTLKDILAELEKPGRDPREQFEVFRFAENVHEIEDLQEGMILPGLVTNVTDFGAFVDIGVHQDGLVHISELADRFVKNPKDVVKVQQKVQVRVLAVDLGRKRISLSMKGL